MKKLFESKILDELYEMRSEGLAGAIRRKYGKSEISEKGAKIEQELIKMLGETIKNKQKFKEIFNKLNEFECCLMRETVNFEMYYYKLGFVDGMYLKKNCKK